MTRLDNDDGMDAGDAQRADPAPPGRAENRTVPEAVARRFLRIGDSYYFPDRSLAFVDDGARLRVRTHNPEVLHVIVAIMQARGWQTVQVSGTPAFRQQLWREATLQGIRVQGYRPDLAARRQLRQLRQLRQVRQGREASRDAHAQAVDALPPRDGAPAASAAASEALRGGLRPPLTGVLLAHAAAPYRFDPGQALSYYLLLRTPAGERTLWGADLERAIAESRSGVQVGDEVVARPRGARPATVPVTAPHEAGERADARKLAVLRTTWTVEKVRYIEALQRRAELVREARSPAALLAHGPELGPAAVALTLAVQFARRLTTRAGEQDRIVAAIREGLARAVAAGDPIRVPALRGRERAKPSPGRGAPRREALAPGRA